MIFKQRNDFYKTKKMRPGLRSALIIIGSVAAVILGFFSAGPIMSFLS